jgi:hypothetical protein
VMAHGITAAPLARRYARWYESHPWDRGPVMESVPTPDHRARGAPVIAHVRASASVRDTGGNS